MPAPEQRRIIFQHIDEPGYTNDIACYQRHGGYEVLKKAVTMAPQAIIVAKHWCECVRQLEVSQQPSSSENS